MNFSYSEKQITFQKLASDTGAGLNGLTGLETMWKKISPSGIPAAFIRPEHEGPGLSVLETALVLERLAASCNDSGFCFSLGAHLLAGLSPFVKHANPLLANRIFPAVLSGEMILANAMTESASGSQAFTLKTTALFSGGDYILNGSKIFCTNAPVAGGILVYALTEPDKGFFGGISCFFLEKGKHTYTVGPAIEKNGLHTSPLAEVFLQDVRVGEENRIGKTGAGAMIFHESMNLERAVLAAMHCGTMERLCKTTVQYVNEKESGNRKLASHQAVQFRIAEMHLRMETARLLAYKTANLIDAKKDATREAAQAKIAASEALIFIAGEALQLHGGNGFTQAYGLGQALADAQAAAIYSGPNDLLRDLVTSRL